MSSGISGRKRKSHARNSEQGAKEELAEWEIPYDIDKDWPGPAKKLRADWWQARISRQKEIDASIAAKAEFEYLYDKPSEDKSIVRVAGPFTVRASVPTEY